MYYGNGENRELALHTVYTRRVKKVFRFIWPLEILILSSGMLEANIISYKVIFPQENIQLWIRRGQLLVNQFWMNTNLT